MTRLKQILGQTVAPGAPALAPTAALVLALALALVLVPAPWQPARAEPSGRAAGLPAPAMPPAGAGQTRARQERLDRLFAELAQPDQPDWQRIEDQIWAEWSHSGSDSMDLLLERGLEAIDQGNYDAAIEHLSALVDHAPDFAEGWNARATAYYRAGLYGPSVSDIAHVLELNPRHFGALMGLGAILNELGYKKDALKAFRAAQRLHPHSTDIKTAIERLESELGRNL